MNTGRRSEHNPGGKIPGKRGVARFRRRTQNVGPRADHMHPQHQLVPDVVPARANKITVEPVTPQKTKGVVASVAGRWQNRRDLVEDLMRIREDEDDRPGTSLGCKDFPTREIFSLSN